MQTYKPKIGLEIHIQPKTKSKMFCRCANEFNTKEPNKNICEICTGQPGTLPATNQKAIELIIKAGLALNCKINKKVHWDRKHYYYPDLPKGYQLTQNETPLCLKGYLEFEYKNDKGELKSKKVAINRLHLEEDAGKNLHPTGKGYSLVDYNRAGAPLIELVTEPVIENKEEAAEFCKKLQQIFRYIKVSKADMEKGQMRCEANVSISSLDKNNKYKDGIKVEVKNINSFKGVEKSIEYEIKRQLGLIQKGEKIIQETRGYDAKTQTTKSQRSKEEAKDYRYFPEPDIPQVNVTEEMLTKIKRSIIELPDQKKNRFMQEFSLKEDQSRVITQNLEVANYFENIASEIQNWIKSEAKIEEKEEKKIFQLAANYLITELIKKVNNASLKFKDVKITAENFAELMIIIYKKEINSSAAQKVLAIMFKNGGDPSQIIEEKNLKIEKDEGAIEKAVTEVIKENEKALQDLKAGKDKSLQFLMGQVMKKTQGKADPKTAIEMIKAQIKDGIS